MPHAHISRDVDIIEINSSPDLRPQTRSRQANSAGKGKKRARPLPVGDVIELSDSDEDGIWEVRKRARRGPNPARVAGPVAGPSRVVHQPPLPLFLPDPDDIDARMPEHSNRRQLSHNIPNGVSHVGAVQAPLPAQQPPVAPPPAAPPLRAEPSIVMADPLEGSSKSRKDSYVAQILEIVPDALPEHICTLVEQFEEAHETQVVEHIIQKLFENPTYPRIDPKGKGKRKRDRGDDDGRGAKSVKVDYERTDREPHGPMYAIQAEERLCLDFPTIPIKHIRTKLREHNQLYAPTYLYLHNEAKRLPMDLPYRPKQHARIRDKGKRKPHEELEKEITWVQTKFAPQTAVQSAGTSASAAAASSSVAEVEPEEGGIECGCCFSNYAFDKMIQCPDAHLFCSNCMTTYAGTLLGSHDANIVCMDQSGCKLAFTDSELRRFLTPKLLSLYERVKQRKEIEAAGLEGLEECPHCDYKVVIENDQEKLFRCQNEDCMAVTCRQCKKPDHLPKSCKEVEEDKKLDARHTIEEAMTAALMRNCPKCQKAFIKEHGCNKMVCPNCHTMSCYACRKVITGYDHFNNPPPYRGRKEPNKCDLWDSVEKRHSEEVTAAAKKAQEEYKRAHPEANDEDLAVDLPPQPVAGPSNARGTAHGAGPVHLPPEPFFADGIRGFGNAVLGMGAGPDLPPLHAALPRFGHFRGPLPPFELPIHDAIRVLQRQRELEREGLRLRAQQEAHALHQERRARRFAQLPPPPPPPPRAGNVYINGVQVAARAAGQPPHGGGLYGGAPLFPAGPALPQPQRPVVAGRADEAVRRTHARR